MSDFNQEETIQGKRRRQGASAGPQSDRRAEAPSRHQEDRGSYGSPAGGGGRRYTRQLPVWVIILIAVCYGIYILLSPSQSGTQTESDLATQSALTEQAYEMQPAQPEEEVLPTQAVQKPAVTHPAQAAGSGQTWTVMLYEDADDRILEQDIYLDLNEVENVGSSDRVQIVVQIDRYKGAYSGDGNWTSTRRYHIDQDSDLHNLRSDMVAEMGEQDMADGNTLSDFIIWAAETYPADKYVLIMSDHGMGWPGGFSDPDPAVQDPSRTAMASAIEGDHLFLMELEKSLEKVVQQGKIDKFELVGMDACLMGHLEVMAALEPYARYSVVSQETEPAIGWAYNGFLQALVDDPDMDGPQLSQQIVSSYIDEDLRINDDQARAEFLRQGSPLGGLFGSAEQISAADLAQQIGHDVTLTAVDLSKVPALIESVNRLAYDLQSENGDIVASARTYAPSYTNIFSKNVPSPYIDLGGFVQMLKREDINSQTSQAADEVLASLQDAIISEKHGKGKRGATGISIYFPNSTLYRSPVTGMQSYTAIADRFANVSLWDDYLLYFFNDIGFKPEPLQPISPPSAAPSRSPGLGQIEVSAITVSAGVASPGNPVSMKARISGKNIGYIYLFVGLYDSKANSIFKADTDYIESPDTKELNGVYYPQWNNGKPFNLTLDWEPTIFEITDGEKTAVALFTPQSYGAAAEDTVYTVDGIYHYADGDARTARLHFRNGKLQQVFGYTDQNETGGAREIIPQAGDTFTILEKWLDLDSSGKVVKTVDQEGIQLTFGSQPFQWQETYASKGKYVLGFIVEDLDGNTQEEFTTVTVQ